MNAFCTLADQNYLRQGLVLYQSIKKLSQQPFILYFLCLDQKSFEVLSEIDLPEIKPYFVEDLVQKEKRLDEIRKGKFKTGYPPYTEFCWSLSPYFTYHILFNEDIKSIIYADSDIAFHYNVDEFIEKISTKQVAIFRHRQYSLQEEIAVGHYNVGVLYFKNTPLAKKILEWWKESTLNRNQPKYATCGDQKYLEGFLKFGKSELYIDGDVGHGAPWHWKLYDFSEFERTNKIKWQDKEQYLYFTHFSNFKYSLSQEKYSYGHDAWTSGGEVINKCLSLNKLYLEYFKDIQWVENNLIKGRLSKDATF